MPVVMVTRADKKNDKLQNFSMFWHNRNIWFANSFGLGDYIRSQRSIFSQERWLWQKSLDNMSAILTTILDFFENCIFRKKTQYFIIK